ncbi:hypothetical protein BCR43DRAFT_491024 [Syncephalastrum racemosum]|uniref:Uncharacterized protein n=1 Tax=Syncephalastrum racemosum TaxID=13706 RepID=A0A1X2HGW1_SYNRA|nr:hypothetical protein BCR43DRAFT_491024 [Syncephalastrum racemosum]
MADKVTLVRPTRRLHRRGYLNFFYHCTTSPTSATTKTNKSLYAGYETSTRTFLKQKDSQ